MAINSRVRMDIAAVTRYDLRGDDRSEKRMDAVSNATHSLDDFWIELAP